MRIDLMYNFLMISYNLLNSLLLNTYDVQS